MDRADDFLGRAAVLRPTRQAAVHPAPTVSRFASTRGTWRHLDVGHATGWSCRLPLQSWPIRLADAMGDSLQDHRASILVLVECCGCKRARRDDHQEPR